MNNRLSLFN